MDVVSIIGFAAKLVQFIDFLRSLVADGNQYDYLDDAVRTATVDQIDKIIHARVLQIHHDRRPISVSGCYCLADARKNIRHIKQFPRDEILDGQADDCVGNAIKLISLSRDYGARDKSIEQGSKPHIVGQVSSDADNKRFFDAKRIAFDAAQDHHADTDGDKLQTRQRLWLSAIKEIWTEREIGSFHGQLNLWRSSIYQHIVDNLRQKVIVVTQTLDCIPPREHVQYVKCDLTKNLLIATLELHTELAKSKDKSAFNVSIREKITVVEEQLEYIRERGFSGRVRDDILIENISFGPASGRRDLIEMINAFADQVEGGQINPSLPNALRSQVPSLLEPHQILHQSIEDRVLSALDYRMRKVRELSVDDAYKNTFRWLLEETPERTGTWDSLSQWIQFGSGCYWVGAKPGSGKSTLFKYLLSSYRLRRLLQFWAESRTLIIASHFLWKVGTDMQKNQEGLLRALLSTILSSRRDLIPIAFPEMYQGIRRSTVKQGLSSSNHVFNPNSYGMTKVSGSAKAHLGNVYEHGNQYSVHATHIHMAPSPVAVSGDPDDAAVSYEVLLLPELKAAFRRISEHSEKRLRICLIIDGLDEFEGDQQGMVDFLFDVTSAPTMFKAIVSSRQEKLFVRAFNDCPKLLLHEYTRADMKAYVTGHLQSNVHFQELQDQDIEGTASLCETVVDMSSGVFLWVKLVVSSLTQGLDCGNTLPELLTTLTELPTELKDLFANMLDRQLRNDDSRISKLMKVQASKLFQWVFACLQTENALPSALRLWFLDTYDEPSKIVEMNDHELRLAGSEDIAAKVERLDKRLRSRCCGFFEIENDPFGAGYSRIALLHRTVLDFWEQTERKAVIIEATADQDFDVTEGLAASIVFSLGTRFAVTPDHEDNKAALGQIVRSNVANFMQYVKQGGLKHKPRLYDYIDLLDGVLSHKWKHYHYWRALGGSTWKHFIWNGRFDDREPLLWIAATHCLSGFVNVWLQVCKGDQDYSFRCSATLSELISGAFISSFEGDTCFRMLVNLIDNGYSFNGPTPSYERAILEPWQRMLRDVQLRHLIPDEHGVATKDDLEILRRLTLILQLFVDAGAPLDVRLPLLLGVATPRQFLLDKFPTKIKYYPGSSDDGSLLETVHGQLDELRATLSASTITETEVRKRRKKRRKKAEPSVDSSNQHHRHNSSQLRERTVYVWGTEPCHRCEVVDYLHDQMGYPYDLVYEGIKGAGADVAAVTAYFEHNASILEESAFTENPTNQHHSTSSTKMCPTQHARTSSLGRKSSEASSVHRWATVQRSSEGSKKSEVAGLSPLPTIEVSKNKKKELQRRNRRQKHAEPSTVLPD